MQLMMNIATTEQIQRAWAFAACQSASGRHQDKQLKQAIITAVSKEARNLGICAGMHATDAQLLFPDLRILFYGRGAS